MADKGYDTTVGRMAGNIAAGLAPRMVDKEGLISKAALATVAVDLAEAIVEELKRRGVERGREAK
jgi:hypothetical protein